MTFDSGRQMEEGLVTNPIESVGDWVTIHIHGTLLTCTLNDRM